MIVLLECPSPTPTVTIRSLSPADLALVELGYGRLSTASRHLRYGRPLADPGRALEWVRRLGDGVHLALGAFVGCGGEPVGVGRYVREGERGEVAVTIVDEWQGRGVGALLLDALLRGARAHGVLRLTAYVLAENKPAIALARRFGGRLRAIEPGGYLEYEFWLGRHAGEDRALKP